MAKLEKQLDQWVGAGLITATQREGIVGYENSRPKKKWFLYGFVMLGVSVISLGVISLIAANWRSIPAAVKLGVDFLLLGGLGWLLYRYYEFKHPLVFDGLAAFYYFFFLASVGLVSQIYHTGGELYQALLFLNLVMFPVVLFARYRFLPAFWSWVIILSLILIGDDISTSKFIWGGSHGDWVHWIEKIYFYYMPLFTLLAGIFFSRLPVSWSFVGFLAGGQNENISEGARKEMFREALKEKFSIHFYHASFFMFLFAIALVDLMFTDRWFGELPLRGYSSEQDGFYYLQLINLVVVALSLIVIWVVLQSKRRIKVTLTLLVLLYLNYMPVCALVLDTHARISWKVAGPVFSILSLLLLSFLFSAQNKEKRFIWMLRLVGFRFLFIYFQALGSLAYTGVGLLVSGTLILAGGVAWMRYGKNIEHRLGVLFKGVSDEP